MKVWITKYALTLGLFEAEVAKHGDGLVRLIEHKTLGRGKLFHTEGREWHRTFQSALARCEEMREAKLKSLENQAAKIRKLDFEKMVDLRQLFLQSDDNSDNG